MRVLDLFSGIGGFSLGLERAGMTIVAFCEIDPFCRRVLAKHWPGVPCHEDITKLRGSDVGPVDVVCGGFPCQDVSSAGQQAGINGARSGLWFEYARLIGELRPRYVIVENVSGLLSRGMGDVLGELAAVGYDSEWHGIPARALGAPHRRDRVWIVGYSNSDSQPNGAEHAEMAIMRGSLSDTASIRRVDDYSETRSTRAPIVQRRLLQSSGNGQWAIEPGVGRVADGVPNRTHRLRALGNAVVPQIPELIGRAIMEVEKNAKSPH